MIPPAPVLLVSAANAIVGAGDGPALARENWAFVHSVGYWAHFDQRAGRSSWPLPGISGRMLAEFARQSAVLHRRPKEGDVFLAHLDGHTGPVHTGIVTRVIRGEPPCHCVTVEWEEGSKVRRERVFTETDLFIRWVELP